MSATVHGRPRPGSNVTPCCQVPVAELRLGDRLAATPALVTCRPTEGPSSPVAARAAANLRWSIERAQAAAQGRPDPLGISELPDVVMATPGPPPLSFEAWLELGHRRGWTTEFCANHDPVPSTDDERERDAAGEDPCAPALRVWIP